jgi:hypothetical protein
MMDELCPECKTGHLRASTNKPFKETSLMRIFVCDNDECGWKVIGS